MRLWFVVVWGPSSFEELELANLGRATCRPSPGAGMCHTDVRPRISEFALPVPLVWWHESAGVVEAVGGQRRLRGAGRA